MQKFILYSLSLLLALQWISCAQQVPLTGGPKDEVPPQLDTAISTDNYMIRFEKQDILLFFDEYVDLKDAAKQIIISPPLAYPPKIDNRLTKVGVAFDEKEALKENATYVINFGESIRDFTEGNKLEDFTFVFSTGDYIDSLSVSGEVVDAYTKEPVEDVVVMLYINHEDSVVYKEKPFYFARTNKEGQFQVNNLRADTFKITAIGDLNLNYTFDSKSEKIAFLDSLFIVSADTLDKLQLEVFKEESAPTYKSYDVPNQGKIQISFESFSDPSVLRVLDSISYFFEKPNPESPFVYLWYTPRSRQRISWETMRNGELDTISARINTRSVDTLSGNVSIVGGEHDNQLGLHPLDTLILNFSRPIVNIDSQFILITQELDTSTIDSFYLSWNKKEGPQLQAWATHNWQAESKLKSTWFPGAITDFYGRQNDTLNYAINIGTQAKFSDLELQFSNFTDLNYIIKLMDKDKEIARKNYSTQDSIITFQRLKPASYSLIIIEDRNRNNRWDPGSYIEKLQSENVYRSTLPALIEGKSIKEMLNLQVLKEAKPKDPAESSETTTPPPSRR